MTKDDFILEILKKVSCEGKSIKTDFKKKTLQVGGSVLIREGVLPEGLTLTQTDTQEALRDIEDQYALYRSSIPSEHSEKQRDKRYFKALPLELLHPDDLIYGEPREVAQARLETTVLLYIISGSLRWDKKIMGGAWFWQSKIHPQLIILRDWTEDNQN